MTALMSTTTALDADEEGEHVDQKEYRSIAGAGCGLTRVGAGEEQARKVVAGEASRSGEDK
jgi:hypothetical protein